MSTHLAHCTRFVFRDPDSINSSTHFRDPRAQEKLIYCDVHDCLESSRDDTPFYGVYMAGKVYAAVEGLLIDRYGMDLDTIPYPFSYHTLPSVDLLRNIEELAFEILNAGKEDQEADTSDSS